MSNHEKIPSILIFYNCLIDFLLRLLILLCLILYFLDSIIAFLVTSFIAKVAHYEFCVFVSTIFFYLIIPITEFAWRKFAIEHSLFSLALYLISFFIIYLTFFGFWIKFCYSCACNSFTNSTTINVVRLHDSSMTKIFTSNLFGTCTIIFSITLKLEKLPFARWF